jgi:hypothetical protein
MLFLQGNPGAGDDEGQDIRLDEGAARAADRIAGLKSLAGMVIILPQGEAESSEAWRMFRGFLRGLFILLQAFLQAPGKKFVVLIHSGEDMKLRIGCWRRGVGPFSERRAGISGGPVSDPGNRR